MRIQFHPALHDRALLWETGKGKLLDQQIFDTEIGTGVYCMFVFAIDMHSLVVCLPLAVPTFVSFLKEVESPYEVHDYIRAYLGDTPEAKEFAKQFLERRAKQKASQQRQQQQQQVQSLCSPWDCGRLQAAPAGFISVLASADNKAAFQFSPLNSRGQL